MSVPVNFLTPLLVPPSSMYLLRQSVVSLCGNAAAPRLFDGAKRLTQASHLLCPPSAKLGRSLPCDNKGCVIHFSFQFVIIGLRDTRSELCMGILTYVEPNDRACRRCWSRASPLMRLWVRILPGACIFVLC